MACNGSPAPCRVAKRPTAKKVSLLSQLNSLKREVQRQKTSMQQQQVAVDQCRKEVCSFNSAIRTQHQALNHIAKILEARWRTGRKALLRLNNELWLLFFAHDPLEKNITYEENR